MKLIDSFNSIYNMNGGYCSRSTDTWQIHETDNCASFKTLTLQKHGATFHIVSNGFYKGLGAVTQSRSRSLKDKDCDGVALYSSDGVDHLVCVDLKSSFKENNIKSAFEQAFFTLLKLHMLMSLCADYQTETMDILFIAACPPCRSEEKVSILDNIYMNQTAGNNRFVDECMYNHLEKTADTVCRLGQMPWLKGMNLRESLMQKQVRCRIITPDNPSDISRI